MADDWFYEANGQPVGPISFAELAKLSAQGTVKPADNVGRSNQAWATASTVPGLVFPSAAIAQTPPDLSYQAPAVGATIVTPRTIDLLKQTGPWVRFLSIMIFIACGMMLIACVFIAIAIILSPHDMPPGMGPTLLIAYLAMALLYIWPAVLLFRYASRCKTFAALRHESHLEQAIEAQKSFWKFMGVLTIVLLGLYLLAIPVVIIIAVMNSH